MYAQIVHIEHTDTRIVISVGRASVTVEVSCMTGEYTAVPACGSFEGEERIHHVAC